jgi:hypothetical protein
MKEYFEYKGNRYKLLLLSNSGSRLFGTSYEKGEYIIDKDYESDYDYKGIIVSDLKDKLKFIKPLKEIQFNEIEKDEKERKNFINILNKHYNLKLKNDSDITLFEIEKFFELINNNNPNSLDILFAAKNNFLYYDKIMDNLYKNKKSLLTKKVFKSFYEYGKSQLYKINSSKKWLNKYPKIENVLKCLEELYNNKIINHEFLKTHFDEKVLIHIDKEFYKRKNIGEIENFSDFELKYEENQKFDNKTINEILNDYDVSFDDLNKYRKPFITDFINVSDLKNTTFNINKNLNLVFSKYDMKIIDFLKTKATLRRKSESIYFIYDTPNENNYGIFTKYKDLKKNDNSDIGEFVCLLSVDRSNFIKHNGIIEDLWKWKTERNKKRNLLESLFGYDVKHAAHLYRLIKKSQEILITNNYSPELNKEEVKFIKSILEGKHSYENILQNVELMQKNIEISQNNLPEEIDVNLLNKFLLEINLNNYNKEEETLIIEFK